MNRHTCTKGPGGLWGAQMGPCDACRAERPKVTAPAFMSTMEIARQLLAGRGFQVTKGGVVYDVGEGERFVCAWVANAPEDASYSERFGDVNALTGRPEAGTVDRIAAWLNVCPECGARVAQGQGGGIYDGMWYCTDFCGQFGPRERPASSEPACPNCRHAAHTEGCAVDGCRCVRTLSGGAA